MTTGGMAAMAALALQSAGPGLTMGEARAGDVATLAQRLLPPSVAARVAGGRVDPMRMVPNTWSVRLWEAPTVAGADQCWRTAYSATLAPAGGEGAEVSDSTPVEPPIVNVLIDIATTYPEPATAEGCAALDEGWAPTQRQDAEATGRMMARLTDAVDRAGRYGRLPFELSCEAPEGDGSCVNARRALATLPLDRLIGVTLSTGRYRVAPFSTPGVEVQLPEPAADGRWPEAEMAFAISPPGARSWRVTLKGVNRLEAVEMRRASVVYH